MEAKARRGRKRFCVVLAPERSRAQSVGLDSQSTAWPNLVVTHIRWNGKTIQRCTRTHADLPANPSGPTPHGDSAAGIRGNHTSKRVSKLGDPSGFALRRGIG